MAGSGPLLTYTEFEQGLDGSGISTNNKQFTRTLEKMRIVTAIQCNIIAEGKVEQHLTLVQNSKARRGSFTSHAFPELHHKVLLKYWTKMFGTPRTC